MSSAEEKSDKIIKGMMATAVTMAVIPAPLGVPFLAVVATGVVGIGTCYGVELNKEDAWKLIREFFRAAGVTFMALNVGGLLVSSLVTVTGAGYPVAAALDAAQGTAIAYAVGHAAKYYFSQQENRREMTSAMRRELGEIMRSKYRQGKAEAQRTEEKSGGARVGA